MCYDYEVRELCGLADFSFFQRSIIVVEVRCMNYFIATINRIDRLIHATLKWQFVES